MKLLYFGLTLVIFANISPAQANEDISDNSFVAKGCVNPWSGPADNTQGAHDEMITNANQSCKEHVAVQISGAQTSEEIIHGLPGICQQAEFACR